MIIYKLCISVIFAADIKITYNNFKSSLVASADCKTIFTTNPGVIFKVLMNIPEFLSNMRIFSQFVNCCSMNTFMIFKGFKLLSLKLNVIYSRIAT